MESSAQKPLSKRHTRVHRVEERVSRSEQERSQVLNRHLQVQANAERYWHRQPQERPGSDELVRGEQGCGDLAQSAPQLLFTNLAAASALLGAFYAWQQGSLTYEEAYFDILSGHAVPVRRELKKRPRLTTP